MDRSPWKEQSSASHTHPCVWRPCMILPREAFKFGNMFKSSHCAWVNISSETMSRISESSYDRPGQIGQNQASIRQPPICWSTFIEANLEIYSEVLRLQYVSRQDAVFMEHTGVRKPSVGSVAIRFAKSSVEAVFLLRRNKATQTNHTMYGMIRSHYAL